MPDGTSDGWPSSRASTPATGTPIDDLIVEVRDRVRAAGNDQLRWRLLLDIVVTLTSETTLDDLLSKIARAASHLAGARYAALGVLAPGGDELALFVTHDLDEGEVAHIGPPPLGHGLLGSIIHRPEPLRLHDIGTHPESYGFPPNHPPMHSFLGVPVRTGDKVFGNLYLTEKIDGEDFTEQDEEIVVALAAAAGVAIENAHLHREAFRRERWLNASAQISAALMQGPVAGMHPLQVVADRAREVAESDVAFILTGPSAETLLLQASAPRELDSAALDAIRLTLRRASQAVRTGTPVRVEDIAVEGHGAGAQSASAAGLGPGLLVPLPEGDWAEDSRFGVLVLAWTKRGTEIGQVDLTLPMAFAEQAAVALQLARGRADRERLAVYDDRERIARDLHDIVIQRLFATGLTLQGALRRATEPELAGRLDESVREIDTTIRDIRATIFELNSMDGADDVRAALTHVADHATASLAFRPTLAFEGPVSSRIAPEICSELIAVLREALSNIARHACASRVDVLLSVTDRVVLRVDDDGRGIPAGVHESGLSNMRRRAERHGGRFSASPGGQSGTRVEWSVPL